MDTTMDLDDLKHSWKSLDARLARIEALQSEANAIERARDAEARANAGLLAGRREIAMGFAMVGVDIWTQRPDLVAWWTASAVVFTALIGAGLRWAYRHPRFANAMQADAAGQSVRRAELALADVQRFDDEAR